MSGIFISMACACVSFTLTKNKILKYIDCVLLGCDIMWLLFKLGVIK